MKKIWNYWRVALLFSIACIAVIRWLYPFPGILPLEFANSAAEMHKIIMPTGFYLLQMNTLVDCGFVVAYTMLTLFSLKILLRVFQASVQPWVYILSFATGCFDTVENIFLLTTAIKEKEKYSWIYFWAVRMKWAFAIAAVLLITIVFCYSLIVLFRSRKGIASGV